MATADGDGDTPGAKLARRGLSWHAGGQAGTTRTTTTVFGSRVQVHRPEFFFVAVSMARAAVFVLAAVAAAAGVAAAWRAGASSASIIPLVGGRNDYVVPLPDEDADSPGTFVLEWDFGRISIGNGDTQSVRASLSVCACVCARALCVCICVRGKGPDARLFSSFLVRGKRGTTARD
jgi:hypothetical protein